MTRLQEAMTAGVFVEFRDADGHTLGQAVFIDWQGRPLPAMGDTMCCPVTTTGGRRAKLRGQVVERDFDVQQEEGQPVVWARLTVEVIAKSPRARRSPFSMN